MGPKGHMHEGLVSTRLGVRPVPALSEEAMVARDLMLSELTGAHLHVAHVSTALSTQLVREAKAREVYRSPRRPVHITLRSPMRP